MQEQKDTCRSLFVCFACHKDFSLRIQLRVHQKNCHPEIQLFPASAGREVEISELERGKLLDIDETLVETPVDTATRTTIRLSPADKLKEGLNALRAKYLIPRRNKFRVSGILQTCPHSECRKTFTSVRQQRTHMLRAHDGSLRPCPICHQSFGSSSALYRHFNEKHALNRGENSSTRAAEADEVSYVERNGESNSNVKMRDNESSTEISEESTQFSEPDAATTDEDVCGNDEETRVNFPNHPAGGGLSYPLAQYKCVPCGQNFRRESLLLFHLRSKHRVSERDAISCFLNQSMGKTGSVSLPLKLHSTHKGPVYNRRSVIKCNLCSRDGLTGIEALGKHLLNYHHINAVTKNALAEIIQTVVSLECTNTTNIPIETTTSGTKASNNCERARRSYTPTDDLICDHNWASQSQAIRRGLPTTPTYLQQSLESSDSGRASEILMKKNEESSRSDSNVNASEKNYLSATLAVSTESVLPNMEIAGEGPTIKRCYRKSKCPYCKIIITRPNYTLYHIRKHHNENFKLHCSFCSRDFHMLRDLYRHQRKAHGTYGLEESLQYSYLCDLNTRRAVLLGENSKFSDKGFTNLRKKNVSCSQQKTNEQETKREGDYKSQGGENDLTSDGKEVTVVGTAVDTNRDISGGPSVIPITSANVWKQDYCISMHSSEIISSLPSVPSQTNYLKQQAESTESPNCTPKVPDCCESPSKESNVADESDKSLNASTSGTVGRCCPLKRKASKLMCPYCKVLFVQNYVLQHIREQHEVEFKLNCLLCYSDFQTFAHLYSHHNQEHKGLPYCADRSFQYSCLGDLNSSSPALCPGQASKLLYDVAKTANNTNNSSQEPPMLKSGQPGHKNSKKTAVVAKGARSRKTGVTFFRPFVCYICDQLFRLRRDCRRHLRNVHFSVVPKQLLCTKGGPHYAACGKDKTAVTIATVRATGGTGRAPRHAIEREKQEEDEDEEETEDEHEAEGECKSLDEDELEGKEEDQNDPEQESTAVFFANSAIKNAVQWTI